MSKQLILYGTSACHLCEEAARLIQPIAEPLQFYVRHIDIMGNEALEARYALRIPVLVCEGNELGWPFNETLLREFLLSQKN